MTRVEIERLIKRRLGREYVMEQQTTYTRYYGGDAGVFVATFLSKSGEQINTKSFEAVDSLELEFYSTWSEQFSLETREEMSCRYQHFNTVQCVPLAHNICFQYYLPCLVAADVKCARANIHWVLDELLQGPEKVQELMKN